MPSTLMLHTPGSHPITLDQLRTFDTPAPQGPIHTPHRHDEVVDAIIAGITWRGWTVNAMSLGVAAKGHSLFGVMDLRGPNGLGSDMDACLGFRSSTNKTLAIAGVAGARVFVCDNLVMSASLFIMKHRSTPGLHLKTLVDAGLQRYVDEHHTLKHDIEMMQNTDLTHEDAKVRLFDLFQPTTGAPRALPVRLMGAVAKNYFDEDSDKPDCMPRTVWGLHNACTRAVRDMTPPRKFEASIAIGKEFKRAALHAS